MGHCTVSLTYLKLKIEPMVGGFKLSLTLLCSPNESLRFSGHFQLVHDKIMQVNSQDDLVLLK